MCARLNENERPFAHLSRSPTRQANHTNVATTTRNILGPVGTSANTTATPMSSKSTSAVAGSSRNQTTPTPGKGSKLNLIKYLLKFGGGEVKRSGGEVVTSPPLNRKVGCSKPTMIRARC